MTPEFASRMRRWKWPFLLVWGAVIFAVAWFFLAPRISGDVADFFLADNKGQHLIGAPTVPEAPPEPQDEWLVVTGNNVLFWPVRDETCVQRNALMQVHAGEKVLVIARHGQLVEVALNNQEHPHTHGCIHETMLGEPDES